MESNLKVGDFIKLKMNKEVAVVITVHPTYVRLRFNNMHHYHPFSPLWIKTYADIIELSKFEKIIYGF